MPSETSEIEMRPAAPLPHVPRVSGDRGATPSIVPCAPSTAMSRSEFYPSR